MYWKYRTNVGLFWIKQNRRGTFTLGVDFEPLGYYLSPQGAARHVFMCATGHKPWDDQLIVLRPADLSEWTSVRDN